MQAGNISHSFSLTSDSDLTQSTSESEPYTLSINALSGSKSLWSRGQSSRWSVPFQTETSTFRLFPSFLNFFPFASQLARATPTSRSNFARSLCPGPLFSPLSSPFNMQRTLHCNTLQRVCLTPFLLIVPFTVSSHFLCCFDVCNAERCQKVRLS